MSNPRLRVPYSKLPLAPADLLAHLVSRGLHIPTPADGLVALAALERIDYYRLLSYMRPLQRTDAATGVRRFLPNTTIGDVLGLYEFDRRLRLLCMDAVERIEVALRASIVSEIAVSEGAHFYLDARYFTDSRGCSRFQDEVRAEEQRNPAIRHYRARYNTPLLPPIWVAMEAVTFGAVSRLYSNLRRPYRVAVARRFALDERVLGSWLRSVNGVRNVAAHHGRLWNASLHVDMPVAAHLYRSEFSPSKSTFFDRAVVIVVLLERVAPGSGWKERLLRLLNTSGGVDEVRMGFPPGWRTRPLWSVTARPVNRRHERVKLSGIRILSRFRRADARTARRR
jgi:abortive infection bacteriophage resistance protein